MIKNIVKYLEESYLQFNEKLISGRHVTLVNIKPLIVNLPEIFKVQELGKSFENQNIYKIKIGSGRIKILCWSQMHGNESTGTNAMFDLFNFFINPLELKDLRDFILKNCTLIFIPILNPDGATAYTRLNAQNIDLNRDVLDLKAPESVLLRSVIDSFKPNYCFNLHDQRTIFSVGKENKPATLSFLAPSINIERDITDGRKETMKVIASMYKSLKELIPGQIGRYTDEFYPTATGDNFQKEGFNTILIEAGHYKNDYNRDITRKYNFIALLIGIKQIAENEDVDYKQYFDIPNNSKHYFDILYEQVLIKTKVYSFGVTYKEVLQKDKIVCIPISKKIDLDSNYNANKIVSEKLNFNDNDDFSNYLLRNEQFSL